jgi:hypothetical protein
MAKSQTAGMRTSQNLENCIVTRKKNAGRHRHCDDVSECSEKHQKFALVKLIRANGGYLGTQRRRRTWLPTICSGELEANIEPEISEWGNPIDYLLNI